MKKLLMVLVCVVSVFGTSASFAQVKIGVFNADQVIQQSAKGKKFIAELKALADKKEALIKAEFEKAEALRKEYVSKQASLAPEKAAEMQKTLSDYQTKIRRLQEDAKKEFKMAEGKGYQKFSKLIEPVVKEMAKAKNLDLIFNRSQSGIVYMSATVDLTAEIAKQIDAK